MIVYTDGVYINNDDKQYKNKGKKGNYRFIIIFYFIYNRSRKESFYVCD